MTKIIDIVKKLYPFDYSVAGNGNDQAIKVFKKYLNFKIQNFPSSKTLNGWKIPSAQRVLKAEIIHKNKKIFDGLDSPFNVISQCKNFQGKIKGVDLLNRLFTSKECPNGIPYNWTGLYRPNQNSWGFCVKKNFLKKIKKSENYFVNIKVNEENTPMRVLDYEIKGRSKKTIIINAHNCHKFQANDDISGCAVAINLFQDLQKRKNLNLSYRLIIAPELFGPMFWLKKIKDKKNFIGAILMKAVGNDSHLKLQKTSHANTFLDKAAKYSLSSFKDKYEVGSFRAVYGNDETVFEAPGNNIPSITFTRFPFKQYHTNLDKPDILSNEKLEMSYKVLKKTIDIIENNYFLKNTHKGLICLSNKKYDLYKNAFAPGVDNSKYTNNQRDWNLLMNCLPMEIEKNSTILDFSNKYRLDFFDLLTYLKEWKNKKLIKFVKI